MARAAAVLCALVALACSDNPYVIGHVTPDAGPADAGAPDAGPADAGRDECTGEHAGALACSGFEADAVTAGWDGTTIEDGGTLDRSIARAHSGSGALHAATSAMMSMAVLRKDFPPVTSGDLYVRAYLFVASGLPTRTINVLFVGGGPAIEPFVGVDINLEDGAPQVFSPQGNPARQTSTSVIPRDRWFCLRARVAVADMGFVQLFVDDALVLDAGGIDTLPPEGVVAFRAGVDWSSEQDDFFELYMDDVVLDVEPVTCL